MVRILVLILLAIFSPLVQAGVIYSITFDTVLSNDGAGVFGGDLLVGQDQPLNMTLDFMYAERPSRTEPGNGVIEGRAIFDLLGIRVFDNTNGLSSDVFASGGGWLEVSYRDERDWFSGAGRQGAASGFIMPGFTDFFAELGKMGDLLPYGAEFDQLVEDGEILLMATAGSNELLAPGSFFYNYVNQLVGTIEPVERGQFSFESRYIPVPSTLTTALFGFFLLWLRLWRQASTAT